MLDLTKNDFFKLILAQNDENVRQTSFSADFSSFRDSSTRWLPKGFQKQDISCDSVVMSFGVNNFRNT